MKMTRKCLIEKCDKDAVCKKYCSYHYVQAKFNKIIPCKTCSFENCEHGIYAKDLCHTHYANYRREPYKLLVKKCEFPKCHRKIKKNKKYCSKHIEKAGKLKKLKIPYYLWPTINLQIGKYNVNYNGGTSVYKNHHLMKKNRIIKIKQTENKCEDCGSEGKQIHHLDKSKINHELSNLRFLCYKCHGKYPKTSKFKRLYGYSLFGLMKLFNHKTISRIKYWHNNDNLKNLIKRRLEKINITALDNGKKIL